MNIEIWLRRQYRVLRKKRLSAKAGVRKQGHKKTATPGDASDNGIPSLIAYAFIYNQKLS